MESDGNGKNSTEIDPLATIHHSKAIQGIRFENVMRSPDSDPRVATKCIIEDPTAMDTIPFTVVDSVVESKNVSRTKELEQRNNFISTNLIGPRNTDEDTEVHVNTSCCDGSKIEFVETEVKPKKNEDMKLTIESIDDGAFENRSNSRMPSNCTISAGLAPSPAITDVKSTTNEQVWTPRSSEESQGLRLNSTNSNLGIQISRTNLNQQGKTNSGSSCIWHLPASMIVSSLPIDSLHNIASFLVPIDWKTFGKCNKATNKICKEIFRRVRMHGFRCATEVITAWVCIFSRHNKVVEVIIFQEFHIFKPLASGFERRC